MEIECPFCGKDQQTHCCDHYLTTICDDGDGFDTEVPLFIAGYSSTPSTDMMIESVHSYLLTISKIMLGYGGAETNIRKTIDEMIENLPTGDDVLEKSLELVNPFEFHSEDDLNDLVWELQGIFKNTFDSLYVQANGNDNSEYYEISHSPGLTWTGTHYWARDGESCSLKMSAAADKRQSQLQPILDAVQDYLPEGD